jgi:hypothetical protein
MIQEQRVSEGTIEGEQNSEGEENARKGTG